VATLSELALRILISAKDETGPGVKSASQGIRSISDQLQQVETIAKRFLSLRLFAGWAQDGIELADAYAGITGKLRQVAGETGNLAAAQKRLFDISQDTQTPLEQNVELYAKSSDALKRFNNGQELAAQLAETVGLSFKAQASNATEVQSTITQLTQAIATDAVQWEDFGTLADTNLTLVNVAAKNLGYDGMGALKKAMGEGKVSNIELVEAIVKGQDEIRAAAEKMPVTVGAAWTMVNNALLKYVGESEQARVSTSAISSVLQGLANNLGTVADVATVLATLMAGRMAQGWLQSAAAARQAAIAAREKAIADQVALQTAQRALVTEAQVNALRVKTLALAVQESRVYAALVAGTEKETAAKKALTAAINQLHAAQTKSAASNAALTASMEAGAAKSSAMAGGMRLLGSAINGVFASWAAWDVGQMVGNWLNQFEQVRTAGAYLAETFVLVKTGAEAMLNGASFADRWQQIKQIHAEFEQIRANDTAGAQASATVVAQSEEQKAQAAEQAAQRQAAAFKQVQDATKALTAQIDADSKAQTATIQQALADKLAALDAENKLDSVAGTQRLQFKLQAAQAETALAQQAAQQKLALIDQEYQAELEKAAANAQRVKEIETEKRQAKLSVYQGLAEYYQGEVAKLSQVYAQENQAAADSRNQLKQLETNYETDLFNLKLKGMTDRQKLRTEEAEFNKQIQLAQKEYDKGEAADKEVINAALARAKQLHGEVTSAAGNGSSAIYDARKRMQTIFTLEKQVLEDNEKAHTNNAANAKAAVDNAAANLGKVRENITSIAEQLNREYSMKIGIDDASLSAAQQTIADLTKPETKVITIQTVNEGGAAPAQATGGMAGFPTGQPWRFADGGWAKLFGKLSGYGGGDKVKALLEPGEFIVRKEAVQKLGVPVLELINQGQLPLQRSTGGSIGEILDEELNKQRIAQIKQLFSRSVIQARNRFAGFGYYGDQQDWRGLTRGSTMLTNSVVKRELAEKLKPLLAGADAETSQQVKQLLNNMPLLHDVGSYGSARAFDKQTRETAKNEKLVFDALLSKLGNASTAASAIKIPALKMPELKLPDLNQPQPQTMAAPSKTVTVQFKAPDGGQAVNATFSTESDVNKMLDILKSSGMRVGV